MLSGAFEEITEGRKAAKSSLALVGSRINIPGNEGFVRQALYGIRYFQKFGVDIREGYNVDSFGHSGMLPQIPRRPE